jgi:hypothetical protein
MQRKIEPQRMTKLYQLSGRCTFAEHLLDRVARHNMNHQEDQRQHQPERR